MAGRPARLCSQPAGRPLRPRLADRPRRPAPEPGRRLAFCLQRKPRRTAGRFLAAGRQSRRLCRDRRARPHRNAGLRSDPVHQHHVPLGRPARPPPAPHRLGRHPGGQLCQDLYPRRGAAGQAGLRLLPGGGAGFLLLVQRPFRRLQRGQLHPRRLRPDRLPAGGREPPVRRGLQELLGQLAGGPGLLPLLRHLPPGLSLRQARPPHRGSVAAGRPRAGQRHRHPGPPPPAERRRGGQPGRLRPALHRRRPRRGRHLGRPHAPADRRQRLCLGPAGPAARHPQVGPRRPRPLHRHSDAARRRRAWS